MRAATSTLLVFLLCANLLPAVPAWAGEEAPPDPMDAYDELAALLDEPGATWDETWKAYWKLKDATAASQKDSDAVKAKKEAAAAAYQGIQSRVAEVLRRDSLSVGAWLMGFFGATLLWGGFAFCVGVARRSGKGGNG